MLRTIFKEANPWAKFWLTVGLVSLFAATAMSFDFGWGVSSKHALFLACLSVVTAFLPHAAHAAWEDNKRGAAIALTVASIPLFAIEFFSHAGYTAGLRGLNISETKVQNVKYDGAQETVNENKRLLEMFTNRLAELEKQNGWAASTTAVALRANLDSAQKAIDLETARGGCKTKCLELMKQKANLEERIAKVEERTDLTSRIEAAKTVIARAREKADTVEHKSSAVEHQNAFLTKAVSLTVNGKLDASPVLQEQVQQAVNSGMALAGTGLPALAFFCFGLHRNRRKEDETPEPRTIVARETPAPQLQAPAPRLPPIAPRPFTAPSVSDVTVGRAVWS